MTYFTAHIQKYLKIMKNMTTSILILTLIAITATNLDAKLAS